MSWTDEELDGLVRNAAGSKHAEYKEAYWHEMEAMLGEKTTSKIGLWWWLSGITLLIGLSTAFVGSVNGVFGSSDQLLSNIELNNQDLKRSNNNVLASTDNTVNKNELAIKNMPISSTSKIDKESDITTSTKTITKVTTSTKLNSGSNPANRSNSSALAMKLQAASQGEKSAQGEKPTLLGVENYARDKNDLGESSNKETTNTTDEVVEVERLDLADWSNEINHSPLNSFDRLPLIAGKRIGFYVAANAGLGQSYLMTKSNNELYQFGVNGGIEFYRKNWAFGTGLGIRQQFAKNLDLVNRRQYYSFGSVNVNQNLTYDRLLFADLNLNASYRFGRSELGLAIIPNFLLGARMSSLNTTEEVIGSKSTMTSEASGQKQYVRSENFNSFGLNVGVNYSYLLVKNISINAGVNARIVQPMLGSSFSGDQRKMPLMIEIGLKKRF